MASADTAFPSETAPPETSPMLAEDYAVDPYPTIHWLREHDPVHFVPGMNFWFVTRYDDVKWLFTADEATNDSKVWERYDPAPEGSYMRWIAENGLFSMEKQEHARVRKLVSVAFTPRAVRRMEAQTREVVERFAAPIRGRTGVVDLMEEFTNPIPNAVISRITGVPAAGNDEVRFRELAQHTIRGFFSFGDARLREQAELAYAELSGWVREMIAERRKQPQEDLISDLITARDGRDQMSTDEVVMMITGLIGAGSETTAAGGTMSITTMLGHPDEAKRVREDRLLLPSAVTEILRYAFGGPSGLPRYAVRDFELRGKSIKKGQMLMLSFAGASRDPSMYPDPDRFDVTRDSKDLLTFGQGPHFCLGANLARAELEWMLDSALDFLPEDAHVREDLIRRERVGLFLRPENLPVDFGS